jgi:hypothetical protein
MKILTWVLAMVAGASNASAQEVQSKIRVLVYIQQKPVAELFGNFPGFSVTHAPTYAEAKKAMGSSSFDVVFACNPITESGLAIQLLNEVKAVDPKIVRIYHGWDYRLEISAPNAIACDADLLVVGGMQVKEYYDVISKIINDKMGNKVPIEKTTDYYVGILKAVIPNSEIWKTAEEFRKNGMPPSSYK